MRNTVRERTLSVIFIALAVFVFPAILSAQDEQDQVQYEVKVNRFVDYISVRDGDGNFVKNLKAEDFTVFVNGKEVKIDDLVEVNAVKRSSETWQEELARTSGGTQISMLREKYPPKHIVLVFDLFNSGPQSIRKAKRTARELLDELLPVDEVSIFQYNYFLEELTPGKSLHPDRARELISDVGMLGNNPDYRPSAAQISAMIEGNYSALSDIRRKLVLYKNFLRSIAAMAEGMAHQKMPKRFIIFSEGPDMYSLDSTDDQLDALEREPGDTDATGPIEPQLFPDTEDPVQERILEGLNTNQQDSINVGNIDAASGARDAIRNAIGSFEAFMAGLDVVVYTVRRGALEPEWMNSAGLDLGARLAGSGSYSGMFHDIHGNRLDRLREIAELTGGNFYGAGTSRDDFVDRIIDQTGNYYQVVFVVPMEIEQEGFNTIDVRHNNDEYSVRHKKGFFGYRTREYFAQRNPEMPENAPRFEKNLVLQSKFFQLPFPAASGTLVSVSVAPENLSLKEGTTAQLQATITSMDARGNVVDEFTTEVESALTEDSRAEFDMLVPLSGAADTIALKIQDINSGAGAYLEKKLGIKVTGETTIVASEPILARKNHKPLVINESLTELASAPVTNLTAGITGTPLASRVVEQGETVQIIMFFTDSNRDFKEIPPEIQTAFAVRDDQGAYAFFTGSEDVTLIDGTNVIRYVADVPVGFAPMQSGNLEIYVGGLDKQAPFILQIPFGISDFDKAKAEQFLANGNKIQQLRN